MAYRRYTDSVLWPTSAMATARGTPARSRFLTAVRRQSCGRRPGTPAAAQAAVQLPRKSRMRRPSGQQNVYGSSFTLHDAQASDDLAASLFGNTTGNTGTSK